MVNLRRRQRWPSRLCGLLAVIYGLAKAFVMPPPGRLEVHQGRPSRPMSQGAPAGGGIGEHHWGVRRGTPLLMAKGDSVGSVTLSDFVEAMKTYVSEYGKTEMPEDFTVPFDAIRWPARLHGVKVGKQYKRLIKEGEIREEDPAWVQQVEDLGIHVGWSDWEKTITGLRVFKQIKGHLKVPSRFAIPSEDPWPPEIHGYRLGVRLSGIRSMGRFISEVDSARKEARLKALSEVGFDWTSRMDKKTASEELEMWFEGIVEGVKAFKKNFPDKTVQDIKATFVIPQEPEWPNQLAGFALGQKLDYLKKHPSLLAGKPDKKEELNKLGVQLQTSSKAEAQNDAKFATIVTALKVHKEVYGTTNVPQSFVVPEEEPWPPETHGVRLGVRANAIRAQQTFIKDRPDRRQMLTDIGFSFNMVKGPKKKGLSDDYQYTEDSRILEEEAMAEANKKLPAGGRQAAKGGMMSMEDDEMFGVLDEELLESLQSEEDWWLNDYLGEQFHQRIKRDQQEQFGMPRWTREQLGKILDHTRRRNRNGNYGRVWFFMPPPWQHNTRNIQAEPVPGFLDHLVEQSSGDMGENENGVVIVPALKKHGTWEMTEADSGLTGKWTPWEADQRIRRREIDEDYWAWNRYMSMGGLNEFGEGADWSDVVRAFEAFHERFGHCNVSEEFVFWNPEPKRDLDDDPFADLRATYTDSGDDMDSNREEPRMLSSLYPQYDDEIEEERRKKKAAALGLDVEDFMRLEMEEDKAAYEWPEELEGLPLGAIADQIRTGNIAAKDVPKRRKALDRLGFWWGEDERYMDLRWDVFIGAFYYWFKFTHMPMMHPDYVIPDEHPWPFFCRGLQLGKMWTQVLREKEKLEKHFPERYKVLCQFGIKWWWPVPEEGDEKIPPIRDNRYNNWVGMEQLIEMGYIDPAETNLNEQPLMSEARARKDRMLNLKPWHLQDHREGLDLSEELELPLGPISLDDVVL